MSIVEGGYALYNRSISTMGENRPQRIGHQIRADISEFLQRGLLKDPRIGFVSVSGVRVTKDIRYANVYISVYGTEKEGTESLKVLQNASGFIRRELGKRLHMRRIPELTFIHDRSIEEGIRMGRLIDELVDSVNDEEKTPYSTA